MNRLDAEHIFQQRIHSCPGNWIAHSRRCAKAAYLIAGQCGMDAERAYTLGLLHDIGRSFSYGQFRHIADGYAYMMRMHQDMYARICLTHSFPIQDIHTYVGAFDLPHAVVKHYGGLLNSIQYDAYDRLIQLCDGISWPDRYVTLAERNAGLIRKYGDKPFMEERLSVLEEIQRVFTDQMGLHEDLLLWLGRAVQER